jgi:hypothetical protein
MDCLNDAINEKRVFHPIFVARSLVRNVCVVSTVLDEYHRSIFARDFDPPYPDGVSPSHPKPFLGIRPLNTVARSFIFRPARLFFVSPLGNAPKYRSHDDEHDGGQI